MLLLANQIQKRIVSAETIRGNTVLNHECESNAGPIAYFMNPKRTLPPMTHSPGSPFVTL